MRFAMAVLLAAGVGTGCTTDSSPNPAPPPDPSLAEQVRRLTAILDYVAADYPGAVTEGEPPTIQERFEYEEQLGMLDDARTLAAELPSAAGLQPGQLVAEVRSKVDAVAAGPEVSALARRVRSQLLSAYGVVLAPSSPPSFERGRMLFTENCVPCHGATGGGDGPQAASIEVGPKPRSFLDPEVMRDLTAARAFSALTDGLDGTAMASYGLLPASDRWSLAFYVLTLRHDSARATAGERIVGALRPPIATTASSLSGASEGALLEALAAGGMPSESAPDALAFLRFDAPYRTSGAPLDPARRALTAGVAAYRAEQPDKAQREFNAAYLDGVEPHEGALRAVDAELVNSIERAFLDLREAVGAGASADEIEQRGLRLAALFDSAEARLASGGAEVAFVSAFVIILREGLEGALLVLLLLGWARRTGDPREARAVHAGWLAAVGVGALTWIVAGTIIEAIGGARREVVEGVISLLAAAVLLLASHFVLVRIDVKRRVAALRERLDAVASAPRRWLVFASLAFVAIYREAFEVVLFLRALMLDASVSALPVVGGAAAAAVALIAVVIALRHLGGRLKPGPLLMSAGTLLCLLAVVLTGKGVRSLQEAGLVGISPVGAPRFDWLGVYPTIETILAQCLTMAAFLAIAVWSALRARQPASDG